MHLLSALVKGLVLLVLVEHLLDLLYVLLIQLLIVRLPLERGAAVLVAQVELAIVRRLLLGEQHVLVVNRVLGANQLIVQMLLVAPRLRVQLPWMKILVLLHELILEVDWTKLAVLTYLIEGTGVEALVRIGDLIATAIVFIREAIQF